MGSEDKRKQWREQKQAYRKSRQEHTLIFSESEARQIESYASEKRMSVTEFIKALIKAYKRDSAYILPKDSTLKDLIIELRRVGTNINQIARYVNTNKSISEREIQHLQDSLSEMERVIIDTLLNPIKRDHQTHTD